MDCSPPGSSVHGILQAKIPFPSPGNLPDLGKEPECLALQADSVLAEITWRREWQPTPVFLPRESHRQRNLVGYSPWGCKELDKTKLLTHTHTHTHTHTELKTKLPVKLLFPSRQTKVSLEPP